MPVVLTTEIKELVNNGLASGNPLLLAAVASDSKPVLSFRGSTQVYSDGQLGLWIRNTSGGTIEAIKGNPHVAMMYSSATTPVLQFHGHARITTDEAERKRVFENAPEREQKSDPERKGAAIVIDLAKVEGVLKFGPDGPVFVKLA
jgi:Pyridoxamine 5'-phosphate oxidase